MAQTNMVSFTIPQADKDAIMQHIAGIKNLLKPHVYPLTNDQRDVLPKMGDKTLPFVQKALEYSETNPEFVPNAVDTAEWKKDLDSWEDMVTIKNGLTQIVSDVKDTAMVLGSEAYAPARFYNDQVKLGVKQGNSSAKPIADDLGKRFIQSKRSDGSDNK